MRSAVPSTRAVLPARLTDEDRVVFTSTGENIHHLADFRVTSEHRVNQAVSGFGGDVESEFVQRVLQRRVEPIRIQFAARGTPTNSTSPPWGCASAASCCAGGRSSDWASSRGAGVPADAGPALTAATGHRTGSDSVFNQRHQQVNTADLRFAAERGNQPCLLHQPQGMVRELGTMTYRARLFIQPVQQILPQRIHIPFIAPRQHRQIAFPCSSSLSSQCSGRISACARVWHREAAPPLRGHSRD